MLLSVVVDRPTTINGDPMENATTNVVTIPELERILAPESFLAESENIMMEWIRTVIQQEIKISDIPTFVKSSLSSIQPKRQHTPVSSLLSFDTTRTCIAVEAAVEEIYFGLMRYLYDGIGLMDYTHSIVHQYTSPTYVVTTKNDSDDDSTTTATLSTVWWNRYIPQDWEYLLPQGWKSWKVWTFVIPDHIYHSLGGWWSSRSIGQGESCAPPETILQSSTLPGHCWPVDMMPKPAMVTIRLQQSIIVTAISIDHSSKIASSSQSPHKHQKQQSISAPKRIRAFGYAPCIDDRCHGLGFEIKSKVLS